MPQVVKSPDAFRTISEVSDALSLEPHVLRFWESKFTQVRPVKRSGGRRYYRAEDVALLAGIKFLLREQGMTIKGAQRLLREKGVRYVAALPPDAEPADMPEDEAPGGAEVVSLDGHRPAQPVAPGGPSDDLAQLVADALRPGDAHAPEVVPGVAPDEAGEPPATSHPDAGGKAAADAPAPSGPPIPVPAHLRADIPDDARLRLPARRPRVDPDRARLNRGAVRRHLAALRELRARMDRQPADAEV